MSTIWQRDDSDVVGRRADAVASAAGTGRYDNVPIEVVTSTKKTVNVDKYYNKERLRPLDKDLEKQPLFIMASD